MSVFRDSQMCSGRDRYASLLSKQICFVLLLFASSMVAFAADPTSSGYLVGPFESQSDMERVYPILDKYDLGYEPRILKKTESLGFIIVSGKLDSAFAGKQLIRELRDSNVDDVVFVEVGEYSNRVSAGVYSRRLMICPVAPLRNTS